MADPFYLKAIMGLLSISAASNLTVLAWVTAQTIKNMTAISNIQLRCSIVHGDKIHAKIIEQ